MFDAPGFANPAGLAELVSAASFLVAGPLIGWLVRWLIGRRIKHRRSTTGDGDRLVSESLRHVVVWWFSLAGVFAALSVVPLDDRLSGVLEKLLFGVFIATAAVTAGRLADTAIRRFAGRTGQPMRSSSIFVKLSKIVIAIIALLVLLQTFGVSITPILTALGVGGLAVALALQDTLSNFFAGLQILATKKVKPGDFVRLETGEEGYVTDIDWRHTSVRQLPSNMVLVPNAKLANSILINTHYPDPEMSLLVEVGVSYGSDLQHVERVTIDVARETLEDVPGGVPRVEPFIRYHSFNDSSIDFTVILRVREFTAQYLIRHEFVKRLHTRYAAEGIVIPFPIRTVDWPEKGTAPRPAADTKDATSADRLAGGRAD